MIFCYPGAVFDLNVQGTPFLDVLKWDHMAACVGFLPDSFNVFLHCLGVSLSNCSRINRQLVQILRSHTYRIFKTYWKMHRDILNNNTDINVIVKQIIYDLIFEHISLSVNNDTILDQLHWLYQHNTEDDSVSTDSSDCI